MPNSPAFVGRDRELRWLGQRSERVLFIVGAGGIGKSALAAEFLHRCFGSAIDQHAALVSLRPSLESTTVQIGRALAQLRGGAGA
ncbi:MAG: hypothetical protein AAGF12_23775, partial [Myxococcota bacterium]